MDAEEQQPIIIVKKVSGHGGHHGGSWKVAYADFVTALMAFFLVMWLVGLDQDVKDNVAGYFNDPANWGKEGSGSILKGGASISLNNLQTPVSTSSGDNATREELQRIGNRLENALVQIPEFESIKEHVEILMTQEGLRIELIEASKAEDDSSYFFKLGSTKLSPKGITILEVIANELGKIPNKIIVEGHTDSRQYSQGAKYTNWELSADRANTTRKYMDKEGLRENQIFEIRGFAANRPMIEDNPFDHRNRRISVVVLTKDPSLRTTLDNKLDGIKGTSNDSLETPG
ncbi:MAG: flagellar motor protein MotB [candidate division Zixibacteria bacterium]